MQQQTNGLKKRVRVRCPDRLASDSERPTPPDKNLKMLFACCGLCWAVLLLLVIVVVIVVVVVGGGGGDGGSGGCGWVVGVVVGDVLQTVCGGDCGRPKTVVRTAERTVRAENSAFKFYLIMLKTGQWFQHFSTEIWKNHPRMDVSVSKVC